MNSKGIEVLIKIEMLRSFSVVAEAGNLAEAANRLGRTQSAVSMTLKRLEEHLGRPLFESERKNRLTPLGQQVFVLAQKQLQQFDDTIDAIEVAADAPRGLLRIAAIPSASGLLLPGAIRTVLRRHPSMKIELRDMDSGQVVDALVHGQADLGIASGEPRLNDAVGSVLFEDAFGLICRVNHPFACRSTPPTLKEVVGPSFLRNNLSALIEDPVAQSVLSEAKVTVHNTHSLIAMVRTGSWVTLLPQTVARVFPSELSFVPLLDVQQKRPVSLLTRTSSQYPELTSEFAEIVRGLAINGPLDAVSG